MNFNESELIGYINKALDEAHYTGKLNALNAVVSLALLSRNMEEFKDNLLKYHDQIELDYKKKVLCEN